MSKRSCLYTPVMLVLAGFGLASCGDGEGPKTVLAPDARALGVVQSAAVEPGGPVGGIQAVALSKVSERRIDRTVYEFVFRVSFKNESGTAHRNLSATVTSAGSGATVVDGSSVIDTLVVGGSASPSDTITIRQDRTLPFLASALSWVFTSPINQRAVPPAPDPVRNANTVPGVDSNNNGLRDDVERRIALHFGAEPVNFDKATKMARLFQLALVIPSEMATNAYLRAIECETDEGLLARQVALEQMTLDTMLRRSTFAAIFAGVVGGKAVC